LALFRFLNGFWWVIKRIINFILCKIFFVISICGPQTIIYAFLGEFHSTKNRARVLIVGESISVQIITLNNW
jgi:hypothetical protein